MPALLLQVDAGYWQLAASPVHASERLSSDVHADLIELTPWQRASHLD
jgi:hypothetical protein